MQIPSLPLFANINENEWNYLREHNMLKLSSYAKNNIIFHIDELIDEIGIVISGIVTIESIDLWGNKSILSNIACGHVFAETYCFCREPLQVEVISASNTEILFLNISRLFTQSDNNNIAKTLSQKITGNMLTISMHKNLILSNRIFCTSPKTVRSRLLIFLSNESRRAGRSDFTIHYDRQQLADYLNVDRTALSKELSKMRDDGLISFKKNQFSIKLPLHE